MAGLGRRSHYRKHLTDSILHDYPEPENGERIAKIVGTRGGNLFEIIVESSLSSSSSQAVESPHETVNDADKECKSNDDGEGNEAPKASKDAGTRDTQKNTTASKGPNKDTINDPKAAAAVQLAILPTKFRKLIWVKRGDYVIVECGNDDNSDQNGIRYLIKTVLYKKQVAHLKSVNKWPALFVDEEGPVEDVGATVIRLREERGDEVDGDAATSGEDDEEDGYYNVNDDDDLLMTINPNRLVGMRIQDSDSESTSSEED
mmetsp:Transcript_53789/g.64902  ORF Transcript_53789/g.64902 Transcript_53789/m.64902 type:complete len:260 (+) Transcript_53789:106-885(+)|eukprot:CAMPEP_0172500716 /NCGR_PEP_ID=MMETSP1066-20121228/142234_1 /TAXON_ID=671091 /ORGANISM="Coscinodiscus wailesii, Strain CCMP2513" /LENGTH=259 /DNA_ID=CAMNT_0013275097 /DNA_START=94 /DNA_END=873 /DNA_ORIENTATION=-